MTGPSNRPGTEPNQGFTRMPMAICVGFLILLQKQLQSYAENIQTKKRPQEAWEAVQNWVVGKIKMAIC